MTRSPSRLPAILRCLGCLLLAALAAGPGCSSKKTATIHGRVTYKGAPVAMGAVYFHGPDDQMAMGNLNEDGSFTATDVPLGEVRVSLQVRNPGAYARQLNSPANDLMAKTKGVAPPAVAGIPTKYADPNTSGLKYPIDSQTTEIEIKLE